MRTSVICLLGAAALAAACSKPAEQKAPDASAPGAATGPAAAALAPKPKPGLWAISMTMNAGPGVSMSGEMCLDEATRDKGLTASPQGGDQDCDATTITPQAGGVGFATTCRGNGTTTTVNGVASGDFNSNYKVDTTIRMDPAPAPNMGEVKTSMQARWLGECKPGQTPGQVSMNIGGIGRG